MSATDKSLDADAALEAACEGGRGWADREAEAVRDQGHEVAGPWSSTERDALALVDCAHDDHAAGECPLAAAASCAAAARWDELAGEETGPPVSRRDPRPGARPRPRASAAAAHNAATVRWNEVTS